MSVKALPVRRQQFKTANFLAWLAASLGLEGEGYKRVWRWNDAPERTLPEVLTALREAAAKAREQEAADA